MSSEYVEERPGGLYVAGTRVSLDSVVIAFNRGESPERILENYPMLGKPGRVYGALAYYFDHKPSVDEYLERREREFENDAVPLSEANPELWARLVRAGVAPRMEKD
jgi:uncharacterized protein (DUF433 family)